jgi:hypothetical protein
MIMETPSLNTASGGMRRIVRLAAILNLAYFGVEFAVAMAIGSVSQVLPLLDLATAQEKADFRHSERHWRERFFRETGDSTPKLKITFIYEPTEEEQPMFGCVARHWIVRRRDEHDQKFARTGRKRLRMLGISTLHSSRRVLPAFRANSSIRPFALRKVGMSARSSRNPVSVSRASVLFQKPNLCDISNFQMAMCENSRRLLPCGLLALVR